MSDYNGVDVVYLDHAGSTPYPLSALQQSLHQLSTKFYTNPHSQHATSQTTRDTIQRVRKRVLQHFHTSSSAYSVVFTAGTTASIQLVADAFPWKDGSFYYHVNSHTSVVGVRGVAEARGSTWHAFTRPEEIAGEGCRLVAYPAQCNQTGERFPLEWIAQLQEHDGLVLLDAASYLATSTLDLTTYKPAFVAMSFYKMFGFPTGLGALLVRNDVTTLLDKHYFGGGTVDAIAYNAPWQQFRKAFHERYEDGTVNFMGIVQLEQAMNAYHTLYGNFDNISLHCSQLSRVLCDRLQTLNHWNGQEVCELYTHSQEDFGNPHKQGPILNLNLRRSDGAFVGYGEVDRLAALHGIHMRCGGFCNPGATQTWLGLATEHVQQHAKAGHVCWDDKDLIDGQPTGSIRVSLGATSSLQDIGALVAFVQTYFVEREPQPAPIHVDTPLDVRLVDIILYPIKSCGGFHVPDGVDWPLTPLGLKHDREWLLVHAETGMALSQKRYPRMCLIKPFIEHNTLHITAPDCPPLVIDLDDDQTTLADSRVCGSTYRFIVYHNRG